MKQKAKISTRIKNGYKQMIRGIKANWKIFTIIIPVMALFIYTGTNKLIEYFTDGNFAFQLGRSPYMERWVNFIAIPLPLFELLIVVLLIIPRTRLTGLYASFFLMSVFTGYVWLMIHESYSLPCACGGILQRLSWPGHLIFNSCFVAWTYLGIVVQVMEQKKETGTILQAQIPGYQLANVQV